MNDDFALATNLSQTDPWIAEAGVDHKGEVRNANRLIDMANQTGCDAVKF
jgi:sialic acid synthase SpsE